MASSSSVAVLLVLVALGGVLADAAGRPSRPLGWNDKPVGEKDTLLQGRVTIPSDLLRNASPLDAAKTAEYAIKFAAGRTAAAGLAHHAAGAQFCQDAKLACNADIAIVDPTLRISRGDALADEALFRKARDVVEATRAMRFGEKDIAKGSEIAQLPANIFHDSYPTPSFLPQSLAEKMPFTSARMPELLDSLNIPHDSTLAVLMARTVGQCELEQASGKEARKCVTSLEDMTSFVASRLPQDKRIAALQRSSSVPGEGDRSKESWKVVDSKSYNRAVVCRNSVFPYAVFQCHDISDANMRIYSVEMEGRDSGAHVTQVATCHEDAIDATATKPTSVAAEACHWVTDSLIWAPAN